MKKLDVVAAIIENDGKFLCMRRGDGKNTETAFKWEFPGGKIDDGETPEQAIVREIREELEIEIDIKSVLGTIEHRFSDFILSLTCFKCVAKTRDIVMNVHTDAKWLTLEEFESLDWAPSDFCVIQKLLLQK